MKLKDILKVAAPAVVGTMAGGLPFLSAIQNPFVRSALGTGIGSIALGRKPKDALRDAVIGGLSGGIMEGMAASTTPGVGPSTVATRDPYAMGGKLGRVREGASIPAGTGSSQGIAAAIKGGAPNATANTMSGELLKSVGFAGQDQGNLLFKLLNTNLGEGIAAGLIAQMLAGDEEDELARGSFERRPYGAGGPGGQLGGIRYADGGLADATDFYPRRNGGIDPNEGSGTKDDVPALLMAGEFVMTRDAVKGAGGGSLKKGIDNMYTMMDQFERMA
jgi:hypothetical protein